jgi:hypothetical protein
VTIPSSTSRGQIDLNHVVSVSGQVTHRAKGQGRNAAPEDRYRVCIALADGTTREVENGSTNQLTGIVWLFETGRDPGLDPMPFDVGDFRAVSGTSVGNV